VVLASHAQYERSTFGEQRAWVRTMVISLRPQYASSSLKPSRHIGSPPSM
jgi:hypothetical protein